MINLGLPSTVDPTPLTVDGTVALVDRFYALRHQRALEVGAGGPGAAPGSGSHPSPGPKKTKRKNVVDKYADALNKFCIKHGKSEDWCHCEPGDWNKS